jgi:hypothetical protein
VLDGSRVNGQPAFTGIREIWTRELFDLQNFLNTANLRFRFRFSSNAATSGFAFHVDQGFNIDNFKVVKTNTTFVNLVPVEFLSFTGRVTPEQTIKLDWDVAREVNHDYYEMEKSTDGTNFTAIGRITGIGPYSFIDENPVDGNNFYRIRQVDKDKAFKFSKTINVPFRKKDLGLTIYPNPVRDALNIEFNGNTPGRVTIQVTDMTGRSFHQQSYTMQGSEMLIRVQTDSWPKQAYVVKVTDANGENLIVRKFIK